MHPADSKAGLPDPVLFRIRDLIYNICGIYTPDNKLYFLQERCARRVQALQASGPPEYFDILTTGPDRHAELRNLLNEITIGDTCFFRGMPQLEALRKVVLPKIVEAKAKQPVRSVKFWSCGCSTGEEPYTLAMLLLEAAATVLQGWTWNVQATDLNDHALAKAHEGMYEAYALRNIPALFQQKYFQQREHRFAISEEVKKRVEFGRLNLREGSQALSLNGNDVIFCANVLIYFDVESKRRAVRRLYGNLLPGGYLFLGTSEALHGVSEEFHLVHFPGAVAYLRPSQAAPGGSPA